MPSRGVAWTAAVVSFVLLLSGCTPPSAAPAFDGSDGGLATLIESADVAVVELDDAEPSVFAEHVVVLTRDQVASMADQLRAGSGHPGTTIDALAGITGEDPDVPPMSYILAGWVRDGTQPGAIAARELMGEQNWMIPEAIIWPDVVLSLLIADITSDIPDGERDSPVALGPVAPQAGASAQLASARLDVGALCIAGANFVQNALATIFSAIDAVAARAEKGIGGIFGTIVGFGIRLVSQVVGTVVNAANVLLDQVLAPVRSALVVVGILQNIASVVRPWSLDVRADPTLLEQAELPVSARFTAKAATEDLPGFAPWVRQCATSIGLELPKPPGAGSPIVWTFQPAIATSAHLTSQLQQVLGDDATSTLDFESAARDPRGPEWEPFPVWITATATGQRTELDRLHSLADSLIQGALASVPSVVRGIVAEVVASVRASAYDALKSLLVSDAHGAFTLPYIMQLPKDEEPPKRPFMLPGSGGPNPFCPVIVGYASWEMSGGPFEGDLPGLMGRIQDAQDAVIAVAPADLYDALASIMLASTASKSRDYVPPSRSGRDILKDWTKAHCTAIDAEAVRSWLEFQNQF